MEDFLEIWKSAQNLNNTCKIGVITVFVIIAISTAKVSHVLFSEQSSQNARQIDAFDNSISTSSW